MAAATTKSPAALAAQQEMASRVLSRRRLLPFIQRMNPKYMAGWVHEDICRRLERFSDDIAAGLSPRLMLLMPPRAGKSEIASKTFPAWHLGRHPDHEIIACSYNVGLAMDFSKRIKALLEDSAYQTVFDARLDPDNKSSESWGLLKQPGSYVAAGVGGGINGKGAHCLPAGTMIATEIGEIDIEHLYQLSSPPKVLSYDRSAGTVVARQILAFSTRQTADLYEITTTSGVTLVLTGDHPVFLPDANQFVRADELERMYGTTESDDRPDVCTMQRCVPARTMRPQQVSETQLPRVLLLSGVQPAAPRAEEQKALHTVLGAVDGSGAEPKCEILQQGVLANGLSVADRILPSVWRRLRALERAYHVLLGRLRGRSTLRSHDRNGEFSLQGRSELRQVVPRDEAVDSGARRGMRRMQEDDKAPRPPRRSRPDEQPGEESCRSVRQAPHGSPQVGYDTLAVVRRIRSEQVTVYDLEVGGTHNFFAEGICVHNCLIIDDPLKNAEEADSATTREGIWNWYGSTAYTRLAPGGGVLIIQTWWHDDDLAGRLQAEMARARPDDMDVDRFEVIKYPAIAEHDEYLDTATDMIVYDAAPEQGRLLRNKGEALHPARFDLKKLNTIKRTIPQRFWSALYQQNPVPDDGAYFTKDQFKRGPIPETKNSKVYIAWDFAISEKAQNDYTVGTVGLQDYDDMLHAAEVVRFKSADAFFIVESILSLAKRWYHPSLQLGFEDGQIYRSIEALLKKRMRETKFYPSIVVLKPITDKMARGRVLQGRMQQGMVSFNHQAEWYDTVRNEMLRFPAGVHDDCVDSLAWMAQMAVGSEPPKAPKPKAPKSWKDKLNGGVAGVSHMAA
jgi:predicted phage terminase large subunit-like protein